MVPSLVTGSDSSGGEPRPVLTSTGGYVTQRSGGLLAGRCCPGGRLPGPGGLWAASAWRPGAVPDHRGPHCRLPLLSLVAAVATLLLAACGQPAARSHTPRSTPTPSPSPTADPTTAAVLNAYEQSWAAWEAAAAIPDMNYPGLAQWATGSALTRARAVLSLYEGLGEVEKGARQLHPVATPIDGSTATVEDCLYSTVVIVYKATGAPFSPQPGGTQPEWDSVTATLVDQAGAWRLSSEQEAYGSSCRPASPSP